MGIGFVLLIWLVFLLISGSLGALLTTFIIYRLNRNSSPAVRWSRSLGAFIYPFIMIGYLGLSFALYAIWCEGYRKVDPGLGDCWHVPIQNDYQLVFIDIPEKGSIWTPKEFEDGSGGDLVSEISAIGAKENFIFGISDDSGYFLLDTQDCALKKSHSKEEWKKWLIQRRLSSDENFQKHMIFILRFALHQRIGSLL